LTFPPRVAIATRNEHKLRELQRICADWPVEWVTVKTDPDLPWPNPKETGSTYIENALIKSREVAVALGVPAIADDSGIEVDALGGSPGPRSARFASDEATDEQNLAALLRAIKGVPRAGLTARYRCVASLSTPEGADVHEDGVCEGTLATKPRGSGGFGYDPIFVPAGWEETMAELTDEQKDRISHRGRAFRALAAAVAAP
jgi:XTP/dITP diphosphohydrolase